MKEIYSDFANYNLWANKKIVDFYLEQSSELLEREIANSFPSIKLTFFHIWDAELIWFKRLEGKSMAHFPSAKFSGAVEEGLYQMIQNSTEFRDFIQTQEETFFDEKCHYQTTQGGQFRMLNREIMQHVFNHSTYHRGQLVMMARQLNLSNIPSTDYIFYLREKNQNR